MNVMRTWIKRSTGAAGRLAGFSLTEVTVGMAVVGIVCTALYTGLTSGLATVRSTRENERATQIMTEKLDTIRLYSWDKIITPDYIPATFTKSFGSTKKEGNGIQVSPGIIYTGRVTIANAPVSSAYSTNMRQVTVTLNWVSGSVPRKRSMTTMVAKNGMQNYIY
jgi:uncharacterized protein (TIGR02598 family)